MNYEKIPTQFGLLVPLVLAPIACTSDSVPLVEASSGSTSGTGSEGDDSTTSDLLTVDSSFESSDGPGPVCGDGTVDVDEECDDAGESATCNADCTTATCGDGVTNAAAGEDCDDGGESATCNGNCTAATCGDGLLNRAAGEICDEGGPTELCNANCTSALCGDSIVNAEAGEQCDDGGLSAGCDDDCSYAECGDGLYNPNAGELCDEGPSSPTCDPDCSFVTCGDGVVNVAAGEECDEMGQTMTCNPNCTAVICGDGVVNMAAGEECDDSGESATCDIDCSLSECGDMVVNLTAGETCDDAGETVTCDEDCTDAICGDGLVNLTAGETCDDGNTGTSCLPGCVPCPDGVVFEEDFSDNSAGWTLGTEWEIGPAVASPSPGSCGGGDPGTDHSPSGDNGIAGAVIGGNVGTALHDFYYLTSPVINAGGYANLQLSFWRWLNSDYTPFMQNRVQVFDGAAWQTVWESGGSPGIRDMAWTEFSYDISAHANPAMQIRIGFNIDSAGVYTCSQWNIDDISLIGPSCPVP